MKVLLSLACAAAIVAAPASAADLFGTAAPLTLPATQGPLAYEAGSNWYVRGDLGISFDVAPTVSMAAISAPPPGFAGSPLPVYSGQNIHATDFSGGVGAGYRFNNYLRFDGTWDYRTGPGGSSSTTVVCPYALSGLTSQVPPNPLVGYLYNTTNTCIGSANINQHNNTFPRQRVCRSRDLLRLHPLCRRRSRFQHQHHVGKPQLQRDRQRSALCRRSQPDWRLSAALDQSVRDCDQSAAEYRVHAAKLEPILQLDDLLAVAWALSAGLGFQLTPSATLDIGYRYLNSGAINNLINPQTGMTVKQNNWSQQIRVGLRYTIQ